MRHRDRFLSRATVLFAAFAAFALLQSSALSAGDTADLAKWEPEIRAFEAADKTNPPPHGAILFLGSSSIRFWKTLAKDFPEHQVINRGFGGSQIVDSTAYAERIVFPYHPKMIVLYAGDNDLAAGKTPDHVFADFKSFVKKAHARLPKTRIAFISIKPSPSRWNLAANIRSANRLIESYCRKGTGLDFIDVFTPLLGADGTPRAELFREDKLHLNAEGYALWTSLIKPHLD